MPSLLLIVFFVELAVHLVNTVGAATINDLVRPHADPLSRRPPPVTSCCPEFEKTR